MIVASVARSSPCILILMDISVFYFSVAILAIAARLHLLPRTYVSSNFLAVAQLTTTILLAAIMYQSARHPPLGLHHHLLHRPATDFLAFQPFKSSHSKIISPTHTRAQFAARIQSQDRPDNFRLSPRMVLPVDIRRTVAARQGSLFDFTQSYRRICPGPCPLRSLICQK